MALALLLCNYVLVLVKSMYYKMYSFANICIIVVTAYKEYRITLILSCSVFFVMRSPWLASSHYLQMAVLSNSSRNSRLCIWNWNIKKKDIKFDSINSNFLCSIGLAHWWRSNNDIWLPIFHDILSFIYSCIIDICFA